jgi:selenium-binding protein 1
MTLRPDPTFHASPKLAMEAPPESFAYTLLLSPDFSKPDALAVIDVKPGSPTYSQVVHIVTMPNKGDEFHHFGWNACSSALSPLSGHAFLERRYLIIPGIRSSRIYIVDTKPDPTQAKIHKIIEPEEIFKKTGYSRPHTIHCGPDGIEHTWRRRQGWHRRPARRVHHGLPDVRGARKVGDRPWPADAAL